MAMNPILTAFGKMGLSVACLVFLTTGCSEYSSQQKAAVQQALEALGKLDAAAEVGVNYQQYGELLIEAKAKTDVAVASLPDSELKSTLNGSVEAYVDAYRVWKLRFDGYHGLSSLTVLGFELMDKYDLLKLATEASLSAKVVDLDVAISAIWAVAGEHSKRAASIFAAGSQSNALFVPKSNTVRSVDREPSTQAEPVPELADEPVREPGGSDIVQSAPPGQIRASHVLISHRGAPRTGATRSKEEALALAKDLLSRIKAGEIFEEVAEAYSDCPSSQKGGDLGFFPKGQMVKPFEEAAFGLEQGDVSGLAETQFGYHIIKRTQ
ncbi:peptidylprolyl isomerase [Candidatus Eisenbacteria bacterium]|uniref:peptidylprolyl isomerase n=1 Tax=Eiseniibacteriota bacterium TaxID=2212470 RepID=A0ABV6YPL4_UNCEI